MRKTGFINVAIALLVLAAILGAGGYAAYKQGRLPLNYFFKKSAEAPSVVPKTSEDKTVDWEIYRNEKYGFEVKYPPEWGAVSFLDRPAVNEAPYPGCQLMGRRISIKFSNNPYVGLGAQSEDYDECSYGRGATIQDYLHRIEINENRLRIHDINESAKIVKAVRTASNDDSYIFENYFCEGCDGSPTGVAELENNHNVSVLIFEGIDLPVLGKLLQSFKSIRILGDTSTWKTYRNEKYGFKVEYPTSLGLSVNKMRDFIDLEADSLLKDVIRFEGTPGEDTGSFGVLIYSNPTNLSVEAFDQAILRSDAGRKDVIKTSATISGIQAIRFQTVYGLRDIILFKRNSHIFYIDWDDYSGPDNPNLPIFNQFLDSFHFDQP